MTQRYLLTRVTRNWSVWVMTSQDIDDSGHVTNVSRQQTLLRLHSRDVSSCRELVNISLLAIPDLLRSWFQMNLWVTLRYVSQYDSMGAERSCDGWNQAVYKPHDLHLVLFPFFFSLSLRIYVQYGHTRIKTSSSTCQSFKPMRLLL